MCLDRPFISLLSACFACITFCICVRILALQCCRQAIADVWPHRRLSRYSEHRKRWDRAYRDRPALPRNDNNTSTEWSAYATLLEGGMDFPLASWLEMVHPVRCNRSRSLCRGTRQAAPVEGRPFEAYCCAGSKAAAPDPSSDRTESPGVPG